MKEALISTYTHWNSYGSIFQSIALQYTLKNIGVCPKTIVFKCDEEKSAITRPLKLSLLYISYFYKLIHSRKLQRNRNLSLKFIDKYIEKIVFPSPDKILLPDDVDIYIAGSDQIWHPMLCREDFFLSYAPKNKKKISYAASMGILDVPEQNKSRFKSLIENIDSYSVREQDMIPIIEQYTSKPVLRHIDPTFLLSKEKWIELEKEYPIKTPFILVYAIYWNRKLNRHLKQIHEKTGIKIVSVQSSLRHIYSNKVVLDAGPEEFLWLIDHSEAVITSSFHGTALSIIMNKRLCPIVNSDSPSRIENLINTLGLVHAESIDEILLYNPNYDEVNEKIKEETLRSVEYLKREIFCEE